MRRARQRLSTRGHELTRLWQRWRRAALLVLGLYCWLAAGLVAMGFYLRPDEVRYPTPDHELLAKAQHLINVGQLPQASDLLERLYVGVSDSPVAADAMEKDALCRSVIADPGEAARLARRAAERTPQGSSLRARRWNLSGVLLLDSGREAEAVDLYRKVLASEPNLPDRALIIVGLMRALNRTRQSGAVEAVFETHYRDVEASRFLGTAYLRLAEAREALGDRVGARHSYAEAARVGRGRGVLEAAQLGLRRTGNGK